MTTGVFNDHSLEIVVTVKKTNIHFRFVTGHEFGLLLGRQMCYMFTHHPDLHTLTLHLAT